jgi:hypothetical protein
MLLDNEIPCIIEPEDILPARRKAWARLIIHKKSLLLLYFILTASDALQKKCAMNFRLNDSLFLIHKLHFFPVIRTTRC